MSHEIALTVVPADGVTEAYAAASGDHNPIHLDEAFAQSVGLPGRILHGLWTAAQLARAAGSAAGATTGTGLVIGDGEDARYALESLSLQFRGMGRIGPEITITGTATPVADGSVEVSLDAHQAGTRLTRNGRARLRSA